LVADDHPLFRSALKSAVAQISADFDLIEACNIRQALSHLQEAPYVSLVLLDLKMPDCSGVEGLLMLRAQFPYVPVVIVSASEDRQQMRKALALGASGYIPKSVSMDVLTGALTSILEGEIWIPAGVDLDREDSLERFSAVTPAQLRILLDLQRGRLNKQIAFDVGVTEATVKAHLTVIFKKLGVANRTQAVLAIQALTDEAA
jgi:DNA-binding NarL/FixJ family response regulator